jgi:hypothetical protein
MPTPARKIQLDHRKLLGFKLAAAGSSKIDAKLGIKLAAKVGGKAGIKPLAAY